MVACINILYRGNRSAVGGGGRVGGFVFFTRFRPFGVDLQKNFSLKILTTMMTSYIAKVPEVKIFSEKKFLQIDSKWSETRKKHESADPSAADVDRFPQ